MPQEYINPDYFEEENLCRIILHSCKYISHMPNKYSVGYSMHSVWSDHTFIENVFLGDVQSKSSILPSVSKEI